jgi:hypothetical protein
MRTLMTDFRLEKWYLDCVSSDGTVFIAYAARLKWGPIGLCYGATITRAKDGRLIQRQSLSFGRLNRGRGSISWCNDGLKASGEWTGGERIARTLIVDEPSGRIEWQCLSANGAVHVRTDGRAMTGSGYVEKLSMTLPPWKLPFTELRWGRFISDDRHDYAVWIDLRGRTQRNWIWVNSDEAVTGTVDGDEVRTDGAQLTLGSSQTVRAGNIARMLLGRFAFLERLLPERLRAIQEDKQSSSCLLRTEGSESRGSSINEVVRWR